MLKEVLSEGLVVEQRHKICIYGGGVSQVEGTVNVKAMKMQGACHVH